MRKFVELKLEIIAELDRYIVISKGDKSVFFPKSLIEYTYDSNKKTTNIKMPEWMARNRGLI